MPSLALRQRPAHAHFRVSFPSEHVIQVTLDRQSKLNCIDKETSRHMQEVWDLFDEDDSLWVGIITGAGRAFCTGADLDEWNKMNEEGTFNDMSAPGLGGLCRRRGGKPIIAAVNGICMGGGFEMVANCDLILASSGATFGLPEVKRGIAPVAGCLPRLARVIGLQRTMELALTGRTVQAKTLHDWGLISEVVDDEKPVATSDIPAPQGGQETSVARAAVRLAEVLCRNSPDGIMVARRGVRAAWEHGSAEEATEMLAQDWYPQLVAGDNFKEGIRAFVEKRPPRWSNPKL